MKRLLVFVLFVAMPRVVSAQTASIEYTLTAKNPLSHLYAIEIEISGIRSTKVDVAMPAWSPGVYAIRNFAGSVQQFEAVTRQNRPLEFEQIDKQTWSISKQTGDDVRVRYGVYSTAFNDEMADVLPASVFMYVAGRTQFPVSVKYETEGSWKVYTALEKRGDRYVAPDYDTLSTSPAFLGEFRVLEFKSGSVPYRVVFTNPRTQMTLPQIESDLQDLASAAVSMFGAVPFKDYTFLVKVQAASGAVSLGYPNSSRLTAGENDFANQSGYAAFMSAAAQGLVKAWYYRAARPRSIAPYEYSRESYTRLLWFTEGVAAYSADMLLVRSGVLHPVEYFVKSSADVDALQHQPGRLKGNLAEASWNTWTRSDNSVNTAVSYVLKGKIAGLLLDAEIRGRTAGAQSLDTVLRHLLSQSEVRREGLADNALEPAIEAATGVNVREYFDAVVRGKNEIDYNRYLEKIGVHADSMKGPATVFFGMEFERNEANQARVRHAIPSSPAEAAKVDIGDVVIALDSERVTFDNLVGRIHSKPLGKPVAITVLRGERLLTLTLTPALTQTEKWSLGELLTATPEQVRLRTGWLATPAATRGSAPR